jgi:hypothetical protein
MVLQSLWTWVPFSVSYSIHSWQESLDGGSARQGRYLHTEQHKQTHMPRVALELTIPVFERAKAVHALDRAATVIREDILYSV